MTAALERERPQPALRRGGRQDKFGVFTPQLGAGVKKRHAKKIAHNRKNYQTLRRYQETVQALQTCTVLYVLRRTSLTDNDGLKAREGRSTLKDFICGSLMLDRGQPPIWKHAEMSERRVQKFLLVWESRKE